MGKLYSVGLELTDEERKALKLMALEKDTNVSAMITNVVKEHLLNKKDG